VIEEYELLTEFVIIGQPPRKSNQRRIVRRGRGKNARPMLIKSAEALQYEKDFILQVTGPHKQQWGSLKEDLRLDINIWYPNRRPDLSTELIKDCLTKAEVIKDDRYIREERTNGYVDKENPRISIRLYRITGTRTPKF
jgi:Holliday junction resolvase RusA-like endonuclease